MIPEFHCKFMPELITRAGWILIALLLVPILAGGTENGPREVPACVREAKSITRADDFVVVPGEKLRQNLKVRIENLSLFAFVEGEVRPVPFQIDELDPEGEWVLTSVSPCVKDDSVRPDRDVDDGRLDGNDELAFMVQDSGPRIRESCYPEEALAVDEIKVVDPVEGGGSWVYLCSFPGEPPRSGRDYVKYAVEEDRLITSVHSMGFDPELPIAPGQLRIQGSDNILDRMKIRIKVRVLGIPFSLDESNFVSELSLYKDGPVRLIRRTRSAVKFTEFFRSPSIAIENVYYEKIAVIPVKISIPFSVKFFQHLFKIMVRVGVDFQNLHGWRFKASSDPVWVEVNGKMDAEETALRQDDFHWFVLSDLKRAFMIWMVFDRGPDGSFRESPIATSLYYVDDDSLPDPPESVPGQSPNVEYRLENLYQLPKGTLYFYAMMYVIDNYTDGVEENYFRSFNQPLQALVE